MNDVLTSAIVLYNKLKGMQTESVGILELEKHHKITHFYFGENFSNLKNAISEAMKNKPIIRWNYLTDLTFEQSFECVVFDLMICSPVPYEISTMEEFKTLSVALSTAIKSNPKLLDKRLVIE